MGEERRNLVSWYRPFEFLYSGNEGSVHLYFNQIRYPTSPRPLPGSSLFLPGWHSWDGGGEGEAAVVKLFWPAWRYFRSATRTIPGF